MKNSILYAVILVAGLALVGLTDHPVYGQSQQTTTEQKTVKYTCPMHPEVVKDKPGKCPKCGMALVKMEDKQQVAKVYTCKMHPEVVMDKSGKCPKCGMALVEKTDMGKDKIMNMKDSAMMKHDHLKKDSLNKKKK